MICEVKPEATTPPEAKLIKSIIYLNNGASVFTRNTAEEVNRLMNTIIRGY